MPNSIIQGLTTATPTGLNRLDAFPMIVLLGLFAKVDPKHPDREVCVRPGEVLEVIAVGRSVAHAVERSWDTDDGPRRKRYQARRHSPRQVSAVHDALLALHNQKVAVRRYDLKSGVRLEDRFVHVLDMFGYRYAAGGKPLDVDDLPPGNFKDNVGTVERPVWRVRKRSGSRRKEVRASGVLFRLSKELVAELEAAKGSLRYTLLARRVFMVLRRFHRKPAAVRLFLLTVRQTESAFCRRLAKTLEELGWDPGYKARSVQHLRDALDELKGLRIIFEFEIDARADQLMIRWHKEWYKEAGPELAAVG